MESFRQKKKIYFRFFLVPVIFLTVIIGVAANAAFAAPPTLVVSIIVNPLNGTAPLNGVNIAASVFGSAQGTINYTFYCNRSDSGTNITSGWNAKFDGVTDNPKTAVCNYPTPGNYTAKVIVERGSAPPAEVRMPINVVAPVLPLPPPKPDIVITNLTVPSQGIIGGFLPSGGSITIANKGEADLDNTRFRILFFWSLDSTITKNDAHAVGSDTFPIGMDYTQGIKAGSSKTISFAESGINIFLQRGWLTTRSYYLGAIADYYDEVRESDENNNIFGTGPITIAASSAPTPNPEPPVPEETISMNTGVPEAGGTGLNNWYVGLHINGRDYEAGPHLDKQQAVIFAIKSIQRYKEAGIILTETIYQNARGLPQHPSPPSPPSPPTSSPSVPGTPSNLLVAPLSRSEIALSWNDNSDNEEAIRIERKIGQGSSFDPNRPIYNDRVKNKTSYTDSGLSPNTEYCYRVYMINDVAVSEYSSKEGVCAVTLSDAPSPLLPPPSPTPSPTPQPADLVIENFTIDKQSANAGDTVKMQFIFRNRGGLPSQPFSARGLLSSDKNNLASGKELFSNSGFPSISPNGGYSGFYDNNYVTISVPTDTQTGNYHIGVFADNGLQGSLPLAVTGNFMPLPPVVEPTPEITTRVKNFAVSGIDPSVSFDPFNANFLKLKDKSLIRNYLSFENYLPILKLWKILDLGQKLNNLGDGLVKEGPDIKEKSGYLANALSEDRGYGKHRFVSIPWGLDWKDCTDQQSGTDQQDASDKLFMEILVARKVDKYDQINVVTHSQGTVIAYNVLKRLEKSHPDIKINNFLSMGTIIGPLSILNGQDRMCLSAESLLVKPKNVENWVNIYSASDPFSRELKIIGVEDQPWTFAPLKSNVRGGSIYTIPPRYAHSQYYQDKTILQFIYQCVQGGECSAEALRELFSKSIQLPAPMTGPIPVPMPPSNLIPLPAPIPNPIQLPSTTPLPSPMNITPISPGSVPINPPSPAPTDVFTYNLYQGMTANGVLTLQKFLQKQGFFPAGFKTTDYFGKMTKQAVQKFQTYYGIIPSVGYVGSATRAKLNGLLSQ